MTARREKCVGTASCRRPVTARYTKLGPNTNEFMVGGETVHIWINVAYGEPLCHFHALRRYHIAWGAPS